MGKTADIMTHELALQLRNTFHAIFTLTEPQVYFAAIRKTYPNLDDDDWELCLYGKHSQSVFLLPLATLGHTLDSMIPELIAGIDNYDAGTTEEDLRACITLH